MKRVAVLPHARKGGLVIQELDGETLVYDLDRDVAHCLNVTAALVWKRCDGKTTVTRMTRLLQEELHSSIDPDMVWLAIKQLQRFHLVENGERLKDAAPSVSRRKLLLKYAPAALALPVIMSISAPTPGQAASCQTPDNRPNDCPCTLDSQCLSQNCNEGFCGPEL